MKIRFVQQGLEDILESYGSIASVEPFGEGNRLAWLFDAVRELFVDKLPVKSRANLEVKKFIGEEIWAQVPGFLFCDKSETDSYRNGVYVAIFMEESLRGAYLVLFQGFEDVIAQHGVSEGRELLSQRSAKLSKLCPDLSRYGFQLDGGVRLCRDANMARNFSVSTVAYKRYEKNQVPIDLQILKDLDAVLTCYDTYIKNRVEPTISQSEQSKLEDLPPLEFDSKPAAGKTGTKVTPLRASESVSGQTHSAQLKKDFEQSAQTDNAIPVREDSKPQSKQNPEISAPLSAGPAESLSIPTVTQQTNPDIPAAPQASSTVNLSKSETENVPTAAPQLKPAESPPIPPVAQPNIALDNMPVQPAVPASPAESLKTVTPQASSTEDLSKPETENIESAAPQLKPTAKPPIPPVQKNIPSDNMPVQSSVPPSPAEKLSIQTITPQANSAENLNLQAAESQLSSVENLSEQAGAKQNNPPEDLSLQSVPERKDPAHDAAPRQTQVPQATASQATNSGPNDQQAAAYIAGTNPGFETAQQSETVVSASEPTAPHFEPMAERPVAQLPANAAKVSTRQPEAVAGKAEGVWDALQTSNVDAVDLVLNEEFRAEAPSENSGGAQSQLLSWSDTIETPLNLILYGPPGTGKTFALTNAYLDNYRENNRYALVSFHQSYSYEDFVEGIRPLKTNAGVSYELKSGVFKQICQRARLDTARRYAILIDEINRGNVVKILGELITLIEPDKRAVYDQAGNLIHGLEVTLPYSGEKFSVPKNVDIIATMNTADRSIALLDSALRRRFNFQEMTPDSSVIQGLSGDGNIPDGQGGEIDLRTLLNALNKRMRFLLHRDQTLGHAYFTDVKDFESLKRVLLNQIIPLMQEYFYDDWYKLQLVFQDVDSNGEKIQPQVICHALLKEQEVLGSDYNDFSDQYEYWVTPEQGLVPESVRKIYS